MKRILSLILAALLCVSLLPFSALAEEAAEDPAEAVEEISEAAGEEAPAEPAPAAEQEPEPATEPEAAAEPEPEPEPAEAAAASAPAVRSAEPTRGMASYTMEASADTITGGGRRSVFCTLRSLTFGAVYDGVSAGAAVSIRFEFYAPYDEYELSDGDGHTLPLYVMAGSQPVYTWQFDHEFTESELSLLPIGFDASVYIYSSDWDAAAFGTYTGSMAYRGIWKLGDGREVIGEVRYIPLTAVKLDPDQQYAVSVEASAGGTVTADKYSAKAGETVTLTLTPDEGYAPAGVSVTGADVRKLSDDTYEFTMPASNVTVTPLWAMSWAALQARISGAAAGEVIVLSTDCAASAEDTALTVPASKSIVLDLNGHTLDRGLSEAAPDGNVITVNGTLTIRDSAGGGKITGAFNEGSGGAVANYGTLTVEGGALTENTAKEAGAIYNASGAVLTVTGGELTNNTVTTWGGGGVVNYGTMTMSDGTITGNRVPMNGGGIWTAGTLTLTGGYIVENVLEIDSNNGGGIYFKDGVLNISGSPQVRYNTKNDLHMLSGKKLTVTGELDYYAYIGVSKEGSLPTQITSGLRGKGEADNFFSSDRSVGAFLDDSGELILRRYRFTIDSGITGGTVTADNTAPLPGETVTLTVTPDPGMKLKSLYCVFDEDWTYEITPDEQGVYRAEMYSADMLISAIFVPDVHEYDIWLGGTQVTDANKNNILGSSGTPTAVYDPETNTLTLNNPAITGENYYDALIFAEGQDLVIEASRSLTLDGGYGRAIYVYGGDLTLRGTITASTANDHVIYVTEDYYSAEGGSLVIEGNVSASVTDDYSGHAAIYAYNAITVTETGRVTASGSKYGLLSDNDGDIRLLGQSVSAEGGKYGVYTRGAVTIDCSASFRGDEDIGLVCGDLTILSGTVTAVGGDDEGIYVTGNALISGGDVTASSADDYAIEVYGDLTITGGTVKATGARRGLDVDGRLILGPGFTSVTAEGERGGAIRADEGIGGQFRIDEPSGGLMNESGTEIIAGYDENGYEIEAGRVVLKPDSSAAAYWFVNIADITGGYVDSERYSAQAGAAVALTAYPKDGYTFAAWQVIDANGASVAVTDNSFTMPDCDVTVNAYFLSGAVPYVDAAGVAQTPVAEYTVVTGEVTTWSDGWYVAAGDVTISSNVTVNGWGDGVNLILCDGARLTAADGIWVSQNDHGGLTIWAQSGGTGELVAISENYAGIGSGYTPDPITINGGVITAKGGTNCAGIGGGSTGGPGGVITVNGGTVNAVGGAEAAGIGGGYYNSTWCGDGGTITINGGTVNAEGGRFAAGIGGSYRAGAGTITINGGAVNAVGGMDASGIGCGDGGSGGTVTLTYGNEPTTRVTASSYGGTVTLKKAFKDAESGTVYPAAESADNTALAGKTLVPSAVHGLTVYTYGCSLSLDGDIAINFYLVIPDEVFEDEGAYVTLNGGEPLLIAKAASREQSDITLYEFKYRVAAKEMGKDVVLRAFSGSGELLTLQRYSNEKDITDSGYHYKVQKYIAAVLKNESSYSAELVALMKAMSDYGSKAQVLFGYDVANAASIYNAADIAAVSADVLAPYERVVTTTDREGVAYTLANLTLESVTTARLFFEVKAGTIDEYSFTVNGKPVTPVPTSDGCAIELTNIAAKDLDTMYKVEVRDAQGVCLTVEYCALSYAYLVLSDTSSHEAALVNVVKAMYLYNKAANAYFD